MITVSHRYNSLSRFYFHCLLHHERKPQAVTFIVLHAHTSYTRFLEALGWVGLFAIKRKITECNSTACTLHLLFTTFPTTLLQICLPKVYAALGKQVKISANFSKYVFSSESTLLMFCSLTLCLFSPVDSSYSDAWQTDNIALSFASALHTTNTITTKINKQIELCRHFKVEISL